MVEIDCQNSPNYTMHTHSDLQAISWLGPIICTYYNGYVTLIKFDLLIDIATMTELCLGL